MMRLLAQIDQNDINLPNKDIVNFNGSIANVLQLVFMAAGAVALIMITLAGLKYVLSQGNPQETAKAKNAIIDAVIGLVIAIAAFSIVRFFVGRV